MARRTTPMCSWTGLSPDGEAIVACDRPATEFIEDEGGRRRYTCAEHAASARAKLAGRFVHSDGRTKFIGRPPSGAPSVEVAR